MNKTDLFNLIEQEIQNGNLENSSIIELIQLCGDYLNLKKLKDYAKENNISYNGAKKCRNPITIFNTKFIIDNE